MKNWYRPCGCREITDLIIHVALQDHVVKGPSDIMKGSSSLGIPTVQSLVVHCEGGYIIVLVCHIRSCNFTDRSRPKYHPTKFFRHKQRGGGDIKFLIFHDHQSARRYVFSVVNFQWIKASPNSYQKAVVKKWKMIWKIGTFIALQDDIFLLKNDSLKQNKDISNKHYLT